MCLNPVTLNTGLHYNKAGVCVCVLCVWVQSLLKGIFQESHFLCVLFVLQALSHLGLQSRFGEIKPMLAALALYEESIDFFPLLK